MLVYCRFFFRYFERKVEYVYIFVNFLFMKDIFVEMIYLVLSLWLKL